jgi:APA family basic amino acid/polyamine antiporter
MSTLSNQPEVQSTPTPGFQQRLGLFDTTMLVMGTMIGSGIFVVSAAISRDVGGSGWLMAVWLLTGLMTIMGALSYAELAGMMPHAGGQYVYLREAFSPLPGFLYGWVCFLIIQTGSIAAVAVVFAKYLGVFFPKLGTDSNLLTVPNIDLVVNLPLPWLAEPLTIFKRQHFTISAGQLVAVGVIVFLTILNCRGVQEGKLVQNIMTVAKVLALALLIILGLTLALDPGAVEVNSNPDWESPSLTNRYRDVIDLVPGSHLLAMLMVAGASMTGSLFAADAWNNITFTAGEIKNPRRNLPLSLALGTGLVIFLYMLANLAYMAVLPVRGDVKLFMDVQRYDREADRVERKASETGDQQLEHTAKEFRAKKEALLENASTFDRGIAYVKDDRVGTAVLEKASPNFGVPFMAAAIMISTFGCVNGMILMGARLYYAMAQDKVFFRSVGLLNLRGVPAVGLILQGLWSILLVFSGSYDELLDFVMFTVLLFYVLTVLGLFVLRWRQPNADRPYRAFGYPLVPLFYVLLCAAISVILLIVKPENTWPGLILTLAGIPVYFFWRWRSARS